MKRIQFPQLPSPFFIANDGFISQWCCKCGNRHIWHFKIYRANKEEGIKEDFIEISCFQDDKGTELRKFYEKQLLK